ncbi:MAG: DNA adenine methylase [Paludibacteraceae bacterium]|nr:DNA adenine methylase [Paludibacteraceae bacterium]
MNSMIKYFGGKNGMFNEILSRFPEKGSYDTYLEPFGGSFAIGFHTPEDLIAPIEIYNDLEDNVWSLFNVLSDEDKFKRFKERCDLVPYGEKFRAEFKELLKCEDISLEDRAFYFFYVNRSSHNGMGGFSMNHTVIRRNMAKSVSDFLSTVDRLADIHQRLSRVVVLHRDGINLMAEFNKATAFMYCDPPYDQTTRTRARYKVDMDMDKQNEFIDACLDSKAKLLISGYDSDVYDRLTRGGFEKIQFEVKTTSGAHEKKTKVETLWKNY